MSTPASPWWHCLDRCPWWRCLYAQIAWLQYCYNQHLWLFKFMQLTAHYTTASDWAGSNKFNSSASVNTTGTDVNQTVPLWLGPPNTIETVWSRPISLLVYINGIDPINRSSWAWFGLGWIYSDCLLYGQSLQIAALVLDLLHEHNKMHCDERINITLYFLASRQAKGRVCSSKKNSELTEESTSAHGNVNTKSFLHRVFHTYM